MSALLKSIAILVILSIATLAVLATMGVMSFEQLPTHILRIALVAGIITITSLLIAWLLRSGSS